MSSRNFKLTICAVVYVVVAIFTYAYVNQRYVSDITCDKQLAHADETMVSTLAGICWPIYWVGKLAFYVTKP